jgi:hypothetical protein
MRHPDLLKRSNDGKEFKLTYMAFLNPLVVRYRAEDGETEDLTWVSDSFFVSGTTGHTYRP